MVLSQLQMGAVLLQGQMRQLHRLSGGVSCSKTKGFALYFCARSYFLVRDDIVLAVILVVLQVATAIRGAIIQAKMSCIPVRRGYWGNKIGKPHTVPTKVTGKCGSVTVRLIPAPRGAGIVAARVPKKVLQMAGIDDCYTVSRGSTKTLGNFVKVSTWLILLQCCLGCILYGSLYNTGWCHAAASVCCLLHRLVTVPQPFRYPDCSCVGELLLHSSISTCHINIDTPVYAEIMC